MKRREEVGKEERMEVTVGNKHERENKVNKNPGLIPALKSLHHFDNIIEAFAFSQSFSQRGRSEGGTRWEGPGEVLWDPVAV